MHPMQPGEENAMINAAQPESPSSTSDMKCSGSILIVKSSADTVASSGPTFEAPGDVQHEVAQDGRQPLGDTFVKVCAMLGMSGQAPYGWAKIHVKPHVGCTMYFISVSVAITTIGALYIGAVPWGIPIMNVPAVISVISFVFCAGCIWRFGPAAASTSAYLAASTILTVALVFMVIAIFTGPMRYSPFGDHLAYIICISLAVFSTMLSGLNGGIAADHPSEPYSTTWPSLRNAAFTTMRLVDGLTDIGFVRILLDQGPDCKWYGKAVPCMHYTRLAIVAGAMSVANLLLMAVLLQITGQASLFESTGSRFKMVLAANTVIMLCELGGITIVLLKVFSDMHREGGHSSERLQREAAFALTSCFTTLFSFCINVLGMSKLLAVLRATSNRFQKRLTTGQRSVRVSPTAPQQDA